MRSPRRGLRVTIKAHVDLVDGGWRALIDPDDPAAWFASYEEMLLPLARVSGEEGGDRFIVGCELAGTLRHEGSWLRLIERVREVFPGELGCATSCSGCRC